jgi:xanthine dehydrogenase molybdopterin-binding subunit B
MTVEDNIRHPAAQLALTANYRAASSHRRLNLSPVIKRGLAMTPVP